MFLGFMVEKGFVWVAFRLSPIVIMFVITVAILGRKAIVDMFVAFTRIVKRIGDKR